MEGRNPVDPLAMYIREVSTVVPLSSDEERRLFRELGGRDNWNDAKENIARRLIESHLPLVVTIAGKHSASGARMLDVIQEGNLALINAVKSFAEEPLGDFTAYATSHIVDAITKAFGEPR